MLDTFISLDDAVDLSGYGPHYLRRLIRSRSIHARRSRAGEDYLLLADVEQLAQAQRPYWQMLRKGSEGRHLLIDPTLATTSAEAGGTAGAATTLPLEKILDAVQQSECSIWLRSLPAGSVRTFVTSPPYWGQRRYADETPVVWQDGEVVALGRESTVEAYVRHSLQVLREMKRALRLDGTIWWIMGDTYQTRTIVRESTVERWENYKGKRHTVWANNPDRRSSAGHPYLKDKDLTLAPFLVAHGAQHLGLYVRAVIIWSKQKRAASVAGRAPSRTHMPEPVKDRPTTGHEYILLMSKSARYVFLPGSRSSDGDDGDALRSVWSFPVAGGEVSNSASFPLELPMRCIRLSTGERDLVADPFAGSGTTLVAAKTLGRHYAGCDISPTYVSQAINRLSDHPAAHRAHRMPLTIPRDDTEATPYDIHDAAARMPVIGPVEQSIGQALSRDVLAEQV
jgi:DNA modification methylase